MSDFNMVERGARAIYYGTAGDEGCEGAFERDTGAGPESCRDMMRAVLAVMREPTNPMIEAYARRDRSTISGDGSHFTSEARQAMHAFIGAALSEDKT